MNGQQQRFYFQAGVSQAGVPVQVPSGTGPMQWFGLPFVPQQMPGVPMGPMPQPVIPNSPNTVTITEVSSTPSTPSRTSSSTNQFITGAFPTNIVSSLVTAPSTSTVPTRQVSHGDAPGSSLAVAVAVPRKIKCIFCSHTLPAPDMLSHIFYHVDYKPFLCKHCGNKFVSIDFLQNHAMENTHLPLDYAKVEDRQLSRVCDLVAGFCQQASEPDKVGSLRTLAEVIATEVMKLPRPPAVFSEVLGTEWVASHSANGARDTVMIVTPPNAMSIRAGFVPTRAPVPEQGARTSATGNHSATGAASSCGVCGVQAPFATLSRLEHLCTHLSEVGLPPLYYCLVCGVASNKLYDLLMHRVNSRHRIGCNYEKLRVYIEARWSEVYGGSAPADLASVVQIPPELLSPIPSSAQPRALAGPGALEPAENEEQPTVCCALCGDGIPSSTKDMVAHLRCVHASSASQVGLQWLFACAACNLSTDSAAEMMAHVTAKKTHKSFAKFQQIWDSVVEQYFDMCFPGQVPDRMLLREWRQDAREVANARANGAVLGPVGDDSDSESDMPPELSAIESSSTESLDKEDVPSTSAAPRPYSPSYVRCGLCKAEVQNACGRKQHHVWKAHMSRSIVCTLCNADLYSGAKAQFHNVKFHGGTARMQDNREALKPDFDLCLTRCFADAESTQGPPNTKRGRKSTPRRTQPTDGDNTSATASREPSPPRPKRKRARRRSRGPSRSISPTFDMEMVYSQPTVGVKTELVPQNDANDQSREGTRTSGSTAADSVDLFRGSKVFCELDDSNVESDGDFESVQLTAAEATVPPGRQDRTPAPQRSCKTYICRKCESCVESRDVKYHVLFHVHEAGTPAYLCKHCTFSSHKGGLVEEHCKEMHPDKAFRLSTINNVPQAMKQFYPLKTICFPDAPDTPALARNRAALERSRTTVSDADDLDSSDSDAPTTSDAATPARTSRKRPRRSPKSRERSQQVVVTECETTPKAREIVPALESPSAAGMKRINVVLPKVDKVANPSSANVEPNRPVKGKATCLKCKETIPARGSSLRKHVRQHINAELIPIFKCSLCEFSYHVLRGRCLRKEGLVDHLKDEHGVRMDAYLDYVTDNSLEAEKHYPSMWEACFGPGRRENLDESSNWDASPAAARKSLVGDKETQSKGQESYETSGSGVRTKQINVVLPKIDRKSASPTKVYRPLQRFLTCRKCQKAVKALPGMMRRRHVLYHIDREVVPILKCKYCEFSTHAVGEGLVEHFRDVHDIYNRSYPALSYRGHIIDNTVKAQRHYAEFLEACFGSGPMKNEDRSPERDVPVSNSRKSAPQPPDGGTVSYTAVKGRQASCHKCGKMVPNHRNYQKQHALTHINSELVKVYECRECGYSAPTFKGMRDHWASVHGTFSVHNDIARYAVVNRAEALTHVDRYVEMCFPDVAQNYAVDVGSVDKPAATAAAEAHPTAPEASACQKCGAGFGKGSTTRRAHVLCHINDEEVAVYECLQCSFTSGKMTSVYKHCSDTHGVTIGGSTWRKFIRNNVAAAEKHLDRYFRECFPTSLRRPSLPKVSSVSGDPPMLSRNAAGSEPVSAASPKASSVAEGRTRPVACQKCGKTFDAGQATSRRAHTLCHINDEVVPVYECLKCSFTSGRSKSMDKHIADVHGVVIGCKSRPKFIRSNIEAAKSHLERYHRECFPPSLFGRSPPKVSLASGSPSAFARSKARGQPVPDDASEASSDDDEETDVDVTCERCKDVVTVNDAPEHVAYHVGDGYRCRKCPFESSRPEMMVHMSEEHGLNAQNNLTKYSWRQLGAGVTQEQALAACFPALRTVKYRAQRSGSSVDAVAKSGYGDSNRASRGDQNNETSRARRSSVSSDRTLPSQSAAEEAISKSTSNVKERVGQSAVSKMEVDQSTAVTCSLCDEVVAANGRKKHASFHIKDGYRCRRCSCEADQKSGMVAHLSGNHGLLTSTEKSLTHNIKCLCAAWGRCDARRGTR